MTTQTMRSDCRRSFCSHTCTSGLKTVKLKQLKCDGLAARDSPRRPWASRGGGPAPLTEGPPGSCPLCLAKPWTGSANYEMRMRKEIKKKTRQWQLVQTLWLRRGWFISAGMCKRLLKLQPRREAASNHLRLLAHGEHFCISTSLIFSICRISSGKNIACKAAVNFFHFNIKF